MSQETREHQGEGRLEGRYANYFEVGHSAVSGEFVIDFGQFYLKNGEAHLHTRIITGPIYIRAFIETLQESIKKYEEEARSTRISTREDLEADGICEN